MTAPRLFRLATLILALFYTWEVARNADYTAFGAQFRYLTIWALTGNLIAAAAMMVPGWGRPGARGDTALSLLAITNALVVISYWRLFLIDPALVNGETAPKPYREYYLHLVGPVLMWVDLFWLRRGFRRMLPVLAGLAAMVLIYAGWAELLVGPRNAEPVGTVTTGLPYPFLNDMAPGRRAGFYGATFAGGVVLIPVFWGIGRLRRYLASAKSAASPAR
ncbi:androgen-induced gene 1 family protein [Mangrovicoccus algicola]|uniref:Pr6Pr family membrane protein n=1 Tax=Mangrovicoccus algicola TaxID=2771008 RepID=A0A8J6YYP3_9RHOB|nr:hypothetical protein [Mangrovicoccus algicola]MBE3640237.1 hypothetical protein [Mangrovicoccus algicola]